MRKEAPPKGTEALLLANLREQQKTNRLLEKILAASYIAVSFFSPFCIASD